MIFLTEKILKIPYNPKISERKPGKLKKAK